MNNNVFRYLPLLVLLRLWMKKKLEFVIKAKKQVFDTVHLLQLVPMQHLGHNSIVNYRVDSVVRSAFRGQGRVEAEPQRRREK